VREHYYESLTDHVERHRRLLDVIESADQEAVLAELAVHGERSFSTYLPTPSSRHDHRLG